jgi:hypothetical protein
LLVVVLVRMATVKLALVAAVRVVIAPHLGLLYLLDRLLQSLLVAAVQLTQTKANLAAKALTLRLAQFLPLVVVAVQTTT